MMWQLIVKTIRDEYVIFVEQLIDERLRLAALAAVIDAPARGPVNACHEAASALRRRVVTIPRRSSYSQPSRQEQSSTQLPQRRSRELEGERADESSDDHLANSYTTPARQVP